MGTLSSAIEPGTQSGDKRLIRNAGSSLAVTGFSGLLHILRAPIAELLGVLRFLIAEVCFAN